MLRSPHAHARIVTVDTRGGGRAPWRRGRRDGRRRAAATKPIRPLIPTAVPLADYCLAVDRVRFVGEPVAAVAAIDRATAEDAARAHRRELRAAARRRRRGSAPRGRGAAALPRARQQRPLARHADLRRRGRRLRARRRRAGGAFEIQRYASTPLETFGCIAEYDAGTDAYAFWTNDQRPGLTLAVLAESLGVPQAQLRLLTRTSAAASATSAGPPTC